MAASKSEENFVEQQHVGKEHELTGDNPKTFAAVALGMEILFLVLFGIMTEYEAADGFLGVEAETRVTRVYGLYQDVHVMIFIGFGFLMTFLKKYGFSSVSYNFIVSAIAIQWSIIVGGFIVMVHHNSWNKMLLTTESLVKGDFAAGAVLISFGAVLGRITPTQLLVMCFLEIIFFAINEHIGVVNLQVVDMGGSIFVHTWGAYFGLAVSYVLGMPDQKKADDRNASNYNSDMFAMIGTVFLWMFWPSFNGALCPTANFARERVVINTVISLCASCVAAFATSRFLTHESKFDMVHIQNATLAGGVAVGSSSDLVIQPWGAIIVGLTAGCVSVIGYIYLSPILENYGLFDTCGVHNLHGIPGIMGGIGGAMSAATAQEEAYGTNISAIFAARETRTAGEQGGFQFAAVCVTLGISITGGCLTGLVLNRLAPELEQFSDKSHWELPADVHYRDETAENEENIPLKQLDADETEINLDLAQD